MKTLNRLRVAILVADGFEFSELEKPRKALDDVGAQTVVISPKKLKVKGWANGNWAPEVTVTAHLFADVKPDEFDALLLPGGVMNPDTLRMIPEALIFIKSFFDEGKPVASICHGPWTLINAGVVKGRTMTSWPSIKLDLINAGANWVDQEVVTDGNLVTSRKPADIPAFNKAMIELFAIAKVKK
ncbi:type 1 glutamine amidotransferase domain-containing protein [soil metagenome]